MRDIQNYQSAYLENPFESQMIRYRHSKTANFLRKYNARNILEIGCGLTPLFHYYDNFESLTIVEPSKLFCKEIMNDKPINVDIINDFFTEKYIDQLKGKFDFIVISSLLHELENPSELLQAAASIADSHTTLHINVPNAKSFHRMLALSMGIISNLYEHSDRQIKYQQNSTFDLDSMSQLLIETGFQILDKGTILIKPFTHQQMQDLLDADVLNIDILDGLDKIVTEFPENGAELYINVKVI